MATNYQVRAGVDSYLLFGEETTFGTEAGTIQSSFGLVQNFSPTPKRNLVKVRGMMGALPAANTTASQINVQQLLRGKFEGSMSVTFNPFNFAFMKYVLGTVSGAGTGASLYNYPRATASTDAEKLSYSRLPSITLGTNYYFGGTSNNVDKSWRFPGAKVSECSISGTIGEPISVSLTMPFANMIGNTTLLAPVAHPALDVFHFTGASIEIPTATPVPEIFEAFTLNISTEMIQLYGLGADVMQQMKEGVRDHSLEVTLTAEGTTYINSFLGSATVIGAPVEVGTVKLTLVGGSNRTVIAYLLNCKIDMEDMANDYGQVIKEKITLIPKTVYFTEQTSA